MIFKCILQACRFIEVQSLSRKKKKAPIASNLESSAKWQEKFHNYLKELYTSNKLGLM